MVNFIFVETMYFGLSRSLKIHVTAKYYPCMYMKNSVSFSQPYSDMVTFIFDDLV